MIIPLPPFFSLSLSSSLLSPLPLLAPGTDLARNITITRIDGGEAASLSWAVLSLDVVRSYTSFVIVYTQSGVSKRRSPVSCSQSGCSIPYEQGGVTVDGLDPDLPVTFDITAVNEENERAAVISLISQR